MKALKKIKPKLTLKKVLDNNGEINKNPNPNIWKVVLYFPIKSDLISSMFFDCETIKSLK